MDQTALHAAAFLKNTRALLIDIDGTLLRGHLALPGLVQFFDFLHTNQIKFQVASNNATKTLSAYQQKISSFGAQLTLDNILTSSTVTAQYVHNKYPGGKVYMIGQSGLEEALTQAGIQIIPEMKDKADAVVVGGDYSLTYDKLKYASLHIQQGAEFIGTNPDLVYPTDEGLVPECGMPLVALETATQVQPVIMGKPNRFMFELGLHKMGVQPQETAMLGDRLETDIQGAKNAGMRSILVETGVDNRETILTKGIQPELVVSDLCDLISIWAEQLAQGEHAQSL